MKLTSRSVSQLLADFRSPEPTPGGGSASALAGAMGASLLAMVAGLPRRKTDTDETVARLAEAGEVCASIAMQLEALVDRDSEAYDMVVAAFQLPKGTEEEKATRSEAIQSALKAATEAPLEVMRRCAEALDVAPVVTELGNPNAASDVQVAVALLGAGLRGARQNVDINLDSLKDADYVTRVREESHTLTARLT